MNYISSQVLSDSALQYQTLLKPLAFLATNAIHVHYLMAGFFGLYNSIPDVTQASSEEYLVALRPLTSSDMELLWTDQLGIVRV